MMKRMIAVAATLVLTASAAFAAAENYTVGIGQFAEHGSLDNCRTGFVEGLAEVKEKVKSNNRAPMDCFQSLFCRLTRFG